MNQVIEIPDSPDRLVATKHNKDCNKQHMPTKISIICNGIKRVISSPSSSNKSPVLTYFRKTKPSIDNDRHDKGKALANSEVQMLTQKVNGHGRSEKGVLPLANLPAIVSLDGSGKSSKVENIPKDGPTFDSGKGVEVLADKGKALANTKVQKSTHKSNGHGQSEKGVLPLANLPAIIYLDGSSKSCEVINIPETGPTFDSGKGVDVLAENNMQPCIITKVYKRRKLVLKECAPPLDIEESKKVVVKCETGSVMKEVTSGSGAVASDGGSIIVDIKDLEVEDKDSRRYKGKQICHFSSEEANAGSSHFSQRERIHQDPAESNTDFDIDANGWRTTHNHWKQRDNKQQRNEIMEGDHKNETYIKPLVDSAQTTSCICYQPNENESGVNTQTESSTSRNRGKRPISCIEESVGQPSTIKSKRKQRDIKQQKIQTVQRDHNKGIEIIDLDDSPIASPCVRDIPDAEELGNDRQTEYSTSRNRGKRPISCIEDYVALSWATARSKRSKNLTRPRLKQNKNLSGPSTSNPVSEPENLSGPSTSNPVSEPENLSGPSTSIASPCVRDIPDAEELGIDRQTESSTSRNRGKRPISCIEDSAALSWATARSKRSENLTRPRLIQNKNLSGPSTSNPVSEPENLSGPSTSNPVSEPENLSGPSTSNPVSEPNIQIHGNNEDLSARAIQMEEDEIFAQQLQQQLYNEELERAERLAIAAAEDDMRIRNDLLQVDREFNENDYEMLLALDEDNYKHQGATHAQINSLPVSTVQTENSQECLICLESPTTGEKIRHLPCLHRFHKACVDEWLSRRTSCPVCKTSVDAIG